MAAKTNGYYDDLVESYLFAEVARRASKYEAEHPDVKMIRMGIGDVTRPLPPVVTEAMKDASDEMGRAETFRGYGPYEGYDFLREAVQRYYKGFGVDMELSAIFISDGAKSDLGNFLDIFAQDNTVLVPDPVYPVYVDTNIMAGRRILYAMSSEENGFLPMPEDIVSEEGKAEIPDIIYLCSPNNPTGAVYTREQLKTWIDYANANGSIILFDAAYECFVTGDLPHSIFEVEGARTCAVEFCSFSKKAGFTGTRCGYTVIPEDLVRDGKKIRDLWLRRQSTKYNGVPYIVQRGAEAVFTEEGEKQIAWNIDYYKENAKIIADTLDRLGIYYTGGKNSPYIWLRCPDITKCADYDEVIAGTPSAADPDAPLSWKFFDYLLQKAAVVGTPGAGFGTSGEAFLRLTAFSTKENTQEAMERLTKMLGTE